MLYYEKTAKAGNGVEFPAGKPNRLSDFDDKQNGAYFVTICTQGRKKFLSQIAGDGSPVPKPIGMIAKDISDRTK